ncbi:hypothetical protein MLD38_035495 [Melastoma candidum]|uniref:Uncharacterized protein n=1 Tax=Melastoma candidum TaxID=119954 RepID=A0ACB9LH65_9MYRT|nr:hypothetical protein MLD38_035495 [Melastoma candidum]
MKQGDYVSLHHDLMVGFGAWEFDPMDLENPFPNGEGSVHLWQGDDDYLSPEVHRATASVDRVSRAGWNGALPMAEGVSDQIVKALLLGKNESAGGNPVIGRNAANERKAAIEDTLNGSDIVFVTDRSSAGRSPFAVNWMTVIAGLAKSTGILTVRIDMTPFLSREGRGQLKPRKE